MGDEFTLFIGKSIVLLVMTAMSNTVVVHCVNAQKQCTLTACMHRLPAAICTVYDDKYLFMITLVLKPGCSKLINATKCIRYIRIICESGGR